MKIIQFIIEHKVISGFIGVIILSIIAYVKDENMRIENKRDLYNSHNSRSNMADAYNRYNNRVANNAKSENKMGILVFICFAWIFIGAIQTLM